MKNTTIKILVLLLVISFTSCISIKPNNIKNTMLDENSLDHINGFYSNVSNNKIDTYNTSLWKQFNYLKKDTLVNWQNHTIELEVINKKSVSAKLWLNDAIVAEKTIKGKIRDGYFSAKRKVKIVGFPLVYFFSSDNKLEIGSSKNNQLIINSATSSYGMIFIMSNGNTQQFTSKYERK